MNKAHEIFGTFTAVDLGRGMAAAMVTKLLTDLGMRVTRLVPAENDPFDEIYPAHRAWHSGKEICSAPLGSATFAEMIRAADICVVGGEDLPGLEPGPSPESLLGLNPRLIVAEVRGAPEHVEPRLKHSVDILVQARAGTMWEELLERPVFSALPHPSYAAALQLSTALFAAIFNREADGRGQMVSSSLWEGALSYATPYWFSAARPSRAFDFVTPKSPRPMIFKCADGKYVQVVLGVAGAKAKLYAAFGIPTRDVDPADRGIDVTNVTKFYGDVDFFAPHFAARTSREVLAVLTKASLPNVEVLPPGGCWSDPQVESLGILKTTGDGSRLPGLPFAIAVAQEDGRSLRARSVGDHPLSGIRVLDLGAWVAGPLASVPLADLGAEVIKVEPLEGDPHRFVHRSFASCNRGKKSIAIDLKSDDGRAILHRLIVDSDILLHNFRPGVSQRLGIDPASLHAINSDLVIVESSAYGQRGPRASQPGFDHLFQAFCGHEVRAAPAGTAPFQSRLNFVDVSTALASAVASTAGLVLNRRSGHGVAIEASLLQTSLFLMSELVQSADGTFLPLAPIDGDQAGFHPAERIYRTADDWIAVAARTPEMARRLCDVLGLQASIETARADWGPTEGEIIAEAIRHWRSAELLAAFETTGVWAERCEPRGEKILDDPAMLANGTVGKSNDPAYGEVHQIGRLARTRGREVVDAFSCPTLGRDTDSVLAGVRYGPDEILRLRKLNVIR